MFYLQAFAKVPSQFLRAHLRGILKGGRCFGPLDPVSNIILNAIWYDLAFPPEVDGDEKEAADVLNNWCLLRMERRSLDGLIALFAELPGGSPDDSAFNEQHALEYLCSNNCDMSVDLSLISPETRTQKEYFTCAASAGRHPESARLGVFHANLGQQEIESFLYFLSADQTISSYALEQLYRIVGPFTDLRAHECPVNTLSLQAWKRIAETENNFKTLQAFMRKTIDLMLCEYNLSHTEVLFLLVYFLKIHPFMNCYINRLLIANYYILQQPIYKLHAVCGVAESTSCYGIICYHVNFLARPNRESSGCMLFFSEFFASCKLNEENRVIFIHVKEKPFFCCPVLMSSDLGKQIVLFQLIIYHIVEA